MADSSTLNIDRDGVMALAAGTNSFRFLAVGLGALAQTPADAQLRLQVVRHYAVVGLAGPALEQAAKLPEPVRRELTAAGVFGQLENVPSGRIEWDELEPRFVANLRVLAGRFPELKRVGTEWERHRDSLELYRCRDGNFQVCGWDELGRREWRPRLLDHQGDAERTGVPGLEDGLMPRPYLLEGVGLGWYFRKLVDATRNRFLNYSSAVFVLEPNLLALAVALHLHDWTDLLAEERVFVLAGPDCGDRYVEMMVGDSSLPLPNHHIAMATWGPRLNPRPAARGKEIKARRDEHSAELTAQVGQAYAACDAAYWARRYARALSGAEDPLRVVLLVSRHTTYLQYCIRDVAAAFTARGMQTRIITEPSDFTSISSEATLAMTRSFGPDLFFVIDHFRHEYHGAVTANVPYVGWVQDQMPHLYDRKCGRSLAPLDFYMAPEPSVFVHEYDYPPARGMAWTMATDDRTYRAEPLPDEELAPYRCDCSFVSNQSMLPRKFHEEKRLELVQHPRSRALMDMLYAELEARFQESPEAGRLCIQWLIEQVEARDTESRFTERTRHNLLRFYLDPLAELMFRQSTLEWIADYCDRTGRTLHIYGRGWEEHPRFARYARGVAANGQQLRAVYQASTVNLQIVGTGALHQRLLDGLASGGFFLIRHTRVDLSHTAVGRFLQLVRAHGAVADVEYADADLPEVAAAHRELYRIMGHELPAGRFKIEAANLALYESMEADGYRRVAGAVFPEYAELSFASAEEFAQRADRFMDDADARRRVATAMRHTVVARYSYGRMVDELLAFLGQRLKETADAGS